MHILLAYIFLFPGELPSNDCGYGSHKAWILETEKLIERKASLHILNPEMASGKGTNECVRFEFQIDKKGHAINLSVKDSTNELLINLAAADALKKYKFRPPISDPQATYTLVFSGIVGAAPPYP